jgi:hypothetical protein
MTTNEAKWQVFLKQFPWIGRYIDQALVLSLRVSRVEQGLLNYKPLHEYQGGDLAGRTPDSHIYLVNKAGESLAHVGFESAEPEPRLRWRTGLLGLFKPKRNLNETVSDALSRLGQRSGDVEHIVSLSPDPHHEYGDQRHVTVYKSPRGFNLRDWSEQLLKKEANRLNQQIEASRNAPL